MGQCLGKEPGTPKRTKRRGSSRRHRHHPHQNGLEATSGTESYADGHLAGAWCAASICRPPVRLLLLTFAAVPEPWGLWRMISNIAACPVRADDDYFSCRDDFSVTDGEAR